MKIEGTHTFQASQERVWKALNDPEELQRALPGCEKLVETEPGKFDLYLKIGIAAVKGSYKGKVAIADPHPPNQVRIRGRERPSGLRKGRGPDFFVRPVRRHPRVLQR